MRGVWQPKTDSEKLHIDKQVMQWSQKYERPNGRFRLNPYRLHSMSPVKTSLIREDVCGSTRYRDPMEEAFALAYLNRTVQHSTRVPGQKFTVPQTSAQEVGWHNFPVAGHRLRKPHHDASGFHYKPKSQCFETSFALEYLKSNGKNLFKVKKRDSVKGK